MCGRNQGKIEKCKEKLYIRTDMNSTIATGHLMRCLSIADAAKEKGIETVFILSDNQAESILSAGGFSFIVLNSDWNDKESELPILLKVVMEEQIEKLLIDSYQITENYLRQLYKVTYTIYIDDLNAFHYPVHMLICYANYFRKFDYGSRYPDAKLMLGMDYTPLRAEFKKCQSKKINSDIKEILLLSGGADSFRVFDGLLEKLALNHDITVVMICGRFESNFARLSNLYRSKNNIIILQAQSNIGDYMRMADLVVSAGGTTLYELCAIGTPTISYSLADNQLDNVRQFYKDGLIDYAGDVRNGDISAAVVNLIEKYKDLRFRKERSKKMQMYVDGYGAERIVNGIIRLEE